MIRACLFNTAAVMPDTLNLAENPARLPIPRRLPASPFSRFLWRTSDDKDPGVTGTTQRALCEINPLRRMRRSHRALVIVTVGEIERVADLVDRFFQQSLLTKIQVCWESIEFLPQPVQENQPARATDLRFCEHKGKNWNVEVHRRNSQNPPRVGIHVGLHRLQDLGGMEPLPFAMVGELGIHSLGQNLRRDSKQICHRQSEFPSGARHRYPRSAAVAQASLRLYCRFGPAVSLQRVTQSYPVDAEAETIDISHCGKSRRHNGRGKGSALAKHKALSAFPPPRRRRV